MNRMVIISPKQGIILLFIALLLCSFGYVLILEKYSLTIIRKHSGTVEIEPDKDIKQTVDFDKGVNGRNGIGLQHKDTPSASMIPETINVNLNLNLTVNDINKLLRSMKDITNSLSKNTDDVDVRKPLKDFHTDNFDKQNDEQKIKKTGSLLTLFTTWIGGSESNKKYNFTIINWASLKPVVNPVVFTNDLVISKYVRTMGWQVRDIPKNATNGMPILKYMYIDAMSSYHSDFYGYANADILFTGDLMKTMASLKYIFQNKDQTGIVITGQRWNLEVITKSEVFPRRNLTKVVHKRGALFQTSAEDYFITDLYYPWNDIPEVIVGALAYDNWLIANARENGHVVIDATRTITAVHQLEKDSLYASHFREIANYNAAMLFKLVNHTVPYHKGFTNCIEQYSDYRNDAVVVRTRELSEYCY